MAEQRYRAVLAVISDGETVTDVAARVGVSRQTVHAWLAKYEASGLEDLGDRSRRPRSCPRQTGEGRGADREPAFFAPGWDPRRMVDELARRGVEPAPSFRADRVSAGLAAAQDELDEWAEEHNHRRPHGADGTWVA